MEKRIFKTKIRAAKNDDGKMVAAGRAVPYGVETVLWSSGEYEEREIILPGAFSQSLQDIDQRALWAHKTDIILGRKSANTLRLSESEEGVDFEMEFPDSPEGISKFENVARGDISEMSFGFNDFPGGLREEITQEGDKKVYKRVVEKAELWEISPVTWAAYGNETSIAARSADYIEQRKSLIDSRIQAAAGSLDLAAARQREEDLREMELNIKELEI